MANTVSSDSVAQDQLRAFIERIERMEEEKKAISDDIRDIYAEAKGNGFDVPVLRQIVRLRKKDTDERMEQEAMLELYMIALGMQIAPRDDEDDQDERPSLRRTRAAHQASAPLCARTESISAKAEPFDPETGEFLEKEITNSAADETRLGDPREPGVEESSCREAADVALPVIHSDAAGNPTGIMCGGGEEASRQVHTLENPGASPGPATNAPETATKKHLIEPRPLDLDAARQRAALEAVDPVLTPLAHREVSPETASEAGDENGHVAMKAADHGISLTGNDASNANPEGKNVDGRPANPAGEPVISSAPAARLVIAQKASAHNSDPRCHNKARCGQFSNFAFCRGCNPKFWSSAEKGDA